MDTGHGEEWEDECVEEMEKSDDEFYELVLAGVGGIVRYYSLFINKEPCMDSDKTGMRFVMEILNGNHVRCQRLFRVEKHVFYNLCEKLKSYGLSSTRGVGVEEAIGMFLMTLGHGFGNRVVQEHFQHSGETISRHFSRVLNVMVMFCIDLIKPPDNYDEIPNHIRRNPKYWPYFKDCIGAIDGTHVRISLPVEEQIPYIGRKGYPTQNIMAACGFDMQFTFVWAGWEGTAHDTRIFLEALRNPDLNFPKPPGDKYYLVDAGYPNMKGFLAPYKGERYQLPEFRRGSQPRGVREIFNQAHSSLRSVIERTFGVWKSRFKIVKQMPNYDYDKQVAIISASMALHNFFRQHAIADRKFKRYDEDEDYLPIMLKEVALAMNQVKILMKVRWELFAIGLLRNFGIDRLYFVI